MTPKTTATRRSRGATRAAAPSRGFTLIELMIAVVIVAILAMIAMPAYTSARVRNNRATAQAFLANIAANEQQYFVDNRAYAACTSVSSCASTLAVASPSGVSAYYAVQVSLASSGPPGFTATATPVAGSVQASDAALSIDSTGAKLPAGAW
jgi:type IV pilus assembly protein PilE